MWRVVTGMISSHTAQAGTALSPEWDRGFDEAFAELISADPDLVRAEFDALIGAGFDEGDSADEPPTPPAPPAPSAAQPTPPHPKPGPSSATPVPTVDHRPAAIGDNPRSPP
jgi:hypothetical protein